MQAVPVTLKNLYSLISASCLYHLCHLVDLCCNKSRLYVFIMSAAEYGEHFERKEVALKPATLPSRKSALSLKLEEFDQTVNNPFMEFAKFDGRVSIQFDRIPLRAF